MFLAGHRAGCRTVRARTVISSLPKSSRLSTWFAAASCILRQPGDQRRMGGGFETSSKDMVDASQIELDEGLRIEPEAWEDFALNDASGVRLDALEPTLALDEPVDDFILDTPDDVLLDTVPQIEPEL